MCTVTIIPTASGYRLVTNRDESRTRPRAEPPRRRALEGGGEALWPTDAKAGGTWVATATHGLTLTILNRTRRPGDPPAPGSEALVSRGSIIPALLHHEDAAAAIDALRAMPLERYTYFRLVAVDPERILCATWNRAALSERQWSIETPVCFASSGLGDEHVQLRCDLWREMLSEHGLSAATQDRFHEHVWPERPHLSVRMSREDARTVSTTRVELDDAGASLRYRDDVGEAPALMVARDACPTTSTR